MGGTTFNALVLERLQKFALENKLLDRPAFGKLEKPRVGHRDRLPTADETAAILSKASGEFRLIFSALRQFGARGVECRLEQWILGRKSCHFHPPFQSREIAERPFQ